MVERYAAGGKQKALAKSGIAKLHRKHIGNAKRETAFDQSEKLLSNGR